MFSTVGYGDFAGGTKYEYIITFFLEFSGLLVFSYISLLLSTLLGKNFDYGLFIAEKESETDIWISKLELSTGGKSVDPSLLLLIRHTVSNSFRFDFNGIIEEGDYFTEMSPALQQKILNVSFCSFRSKFGIFFDELNEGFTNLVIINLQARFYNEDETIFYPGEKITYLSLIS